MGSKKKPSTAGVSAKAEKEADLVMGTNNSSIVSKRSVEMLYYRKPHFFRYFVKKPQRRSPLINRGYWLRMHAMAETVRQFMKAPSDKPKFVLNLGCGFDPLPFMLLAGESALCNNTTFVDIDYEKLMVNKKISIQRTPEITDHLEDIEFLPDENPIQIRSKKYLAVGCDLKNLDKLDKTLRTEVLPEKCEVLFLAEVSLTYMDVKSANAVVNWASKLSEDAQFCVLEQFFPDGPDHPFASTMMKHFKKLGAPLYSIHQYPSLNEQEQRFTDAGWAHAHARSLWDLWSDDDFVPSSLRTSLDSIEPFDEWEELALFASHYFLLHASTKPNPVPNTQATTQGCNPQSDVSKLYSLLPQCPPGSGQRRFGALVSDGEGCSLGYHSGLGRQTRLASTDLYAPSEKITGPEHPFPSRDIQARMCHTITELTDNRCLLVGGRASPASGFQDCWLREHDQWRRVQSLPGPRYRHSAVNVKLESECVVIYGGKSNDTAVLDTWLLWDGNAREWKPVDTQGAKLSARFGACLATVTDTSGVLFGGIGQDGTILEDFWTWKLRQRHDGSFVLDLDSQTEKLQSLPEFKHVNRFGATINQTADGLIVIGGIIPRRTVPLDKEIMRLDTAKLLQDLSPEGSSSIISSIGLGEERLAGPRPLLVGHASCVVDPGHILILGGGAVCFSFGTFWTQGTWLLKDIASAIRNDWVLVPETIQSSNPESTNGPMPSVQTGTTTTTSKVGDDEIVSIRRVEIENSAQFDEIVADGKPVIISAADVGPCTELWTEEYLASAVGPDREVVVHESQSETMNFQSKNFSYVTKPFGIFLKEVHKGGRQYLRSISTEEPTKLPANLPLDFPALKDDFRLPEALGVVTENAHSSPLRISGPVNLWLHYD
ncbi:tRNA methyltransferase ppm2, partial [Aspergillus nanangensis]